MPTVIQRVTNNRAYRMDVVSVQFTEQEALDMYVMYLALNGLPELDRAGRVSTSAIDGYLRFRGSLWDEEMKGRTMTITGSPGSITHFHRWISKQQEKHHG